MKRHKQFAIIGIAVIVLFGIYNVTGYIPIIGEKIADKKIAQYQSEIYNKNDEVKTKYNWYNASYEDVDSKDKAFFLFYNLKTNYIWDEYKMSQWYNQLTSEFESIRLQMPENISLESAYISGCINADDYSEKQELSFSIYNIDQISADESKKKAAEITMEVIDTLKKTHNIKGVCVWYFDRNGGYKIGKMGNQNTVITYDWLLKHTDKMNELGEEEQKWISEIQ